jgi:hypothetical protein
MPDTSKCFSLVRGRVMRVTKLDGCGAPIADPCASITSDGFVSVGFTANVDEGEEISITNASGKVCVRDTPCPTFTGYSVEIAFCQVNPELMAIVTGQAPVYDVEQANLATGFRVNSEVSGCDTGFALEVWSNVPGVQCEPGGGAGAYGYLLVPFLQGGVFGDFTIENDAVTFTVTGAATKTGSGWGVGPYAVVAGTGGAAQELAQPIEKGDHLHVQLTTIAPPEPSCECVAVPA